MKTFKTILKVGTKVLSVAMLGLVIFIVGAHFVEGIDLNGHGLSTTEIQLTFAMGCLFLGALIGLKWEFVGGFLSIISFAAFAIVQGSVMQGMVFYVFLLIAFLNLILYALSRRSV